jgi:hypothetical protein
MLSIDVNNNVYIVQKYQMKPFLPFYCRHLHPPSRCNDNDHAHAPCNSQFYQRSILFACVVSVSEPVGDTKLEFECLDFILKNSHIFIRNMTVEIPTT